MALTQAELDEAQAQINAARDQTHTNIGLAEGWAQIAQDAADASGAESAQTATAEANRAGQQKALAETARTGAETARTGAETARTGAETARIGAETARSGAVTAQGLAEDARDRAEAVPDAVDTLVPTLLADPTSGTRVAFDGTYAARGAAPVDVRLWGATGNGSADDTAAIQQAITDNPGRTIALTPNPLGVANYRVSTSYQTGSDGPTALRISADHTRLLIPAGVSLSMTPTSATHYTIVDLHTGVGVGIEGDGRVVGDVQTHTGTTGEQGYGVLVYGTTDAYVGPLELRECWGEGLMIYGDAGHTTVDRTVFDSNRRNGAADIWSHGTRWINPVGRNTGQIKMAPNGPGAGICVEPDPETGHDVTGWTMVSPVCYNNKGMGLELACGNQQKNHGVVTALDSHGNVGAGIASHAIAKGGSPTPMSVDMDVRVISPTVVGNATGLNINLHTVVNVVGGSVSGSNNYGVECKGTIRTVGLEVVNNRLGSWYVVGAGARAEVQGGVAGTTKARTTSAASEMQIEGTMHASGLAMVNRAGTYQANWGLNLKAGSEASTFLNCTASGPIASGWLNNESGALVTPRPGVKVPTQPEVDTALAAKVTNKGGAAGLWIDTTANLPATGETGVLYVTTD